MGKLLEIYLVDLQHVVEASAMEVLIFMVVLVFLGISVQQMLLT